VKRYVKKPIAVEAMQLTNESIQNVVDWIHNTDTRAYWAGENNLVIETLEGDMLAREGDYVIRGVRGEFYPCAKDIFEETYEEV
jgi:hypothetical protein